MLLTCVAVYPPRANVAVRPKADARPFRVRFGPGPEPTTLNPTTAEGQDALPVHNLTLESLLSPDPDTYQWTPALAESWRFTDDDRAIEFTLRPDAKWCDGRPVTAEDVRFTFDAIRDPASQMAFLRPFYSTFSRVDVIDRRRVRFHLRRAYFGNLIQSASLKILPRHIYQDPARAAKLNETLCGSGPYAVTSWTRGRAINLKQNPHWWGRAHAPWRERYRPRTMSFVFVADDQRALEMMEREELDFAELAPETVTRRRTIRRESERFDVQEVINREPAGTSQITLNLRDPIFADRRVREALSLAVDREAMISHLYGGAAVKATGPWYRQSPFADPGAGEPGYDPRRALHLLREAGWADDGRGWLAREVDGRAVRLSFTVLAAGEKDVRLLTMVKEDLARLGVDVRIRRFDENSVYRALVGRTFQAAINADRGRYVNFDPRAEFWSRGGANFAGLADPVVDQLIERVATTENFGARGKLMRQIFRRVTDARIAIPLLNDRASYYAYGRRVTRARPHTNYTPGVELMDLVETAR